MTRLDKTLDKARFTVRIKATDQLGVPAVKFVLDGEERELDGPTSKAKYAAKNLAQGRHVIVVTVEDKVCQKTGAVTVVEAPPCSVNCAASASSHREDGFS